MKKCLFELGGSDAFLVLDDADVKLAASKAIIGRLHNNGQSCINSKRFIIHEKVYDDFKKYVIEELRQQKIGDPMDPSITIGPLVNKKQKDGLIK
jgi:acyl-CoA reductase-like NAD-dependent aldehyde dehydrogenase